MTSATRSTSLCAVALTVLAHIVFAAGAAPPAPTPLGPANGASVQVPFTISWSAVTDPAGIVAYNWQVSTTSAFSPVILQDSTSGQTQDTVSGLADGTYFWRVQAVNGAFEQGAWSAARSFTVTGAGPGSPGTPVLEPTLAYSTFHPHEVIRFQWSAVADAASYVLEAATDSSFPVATTIRIDNIPAPSYAFAIANPEGSYVARVRAVSAGGIAGVPSNVISFSVFYNNPIGPPPAIVSPVNNPTLTLPVTLTWAHVPNPQPSGYEVQIARDAGFTNIEEDAPQLNGPSRTVLSLTSGSKFWRVRSTQGDASPTTAAMTAWSATGTFTISSAPPKPVSVVTTKDPVFSGETTWMQLQLTSAAPSSGASIALTSSNPGALPVPASVTMQGNIGWMQFQVQAGQVASPTPVTITATLNGGSASGQFTVMPPSVKWVSLSPSTISGGTSAGGIVMLNGQAPPSGAAVTLSSNSPAVMPPSTVTVAPGEFSVSFDVPTANVSQSTAATVTASWNGMAVQSSLTVTPGPVPVSLSLLPSTVVGGSAGSVDGTVTIGSAATFDQFLQVTTSHPSITPFLAHSVVVPAGSTRGLIQISTSTVSATTVITISVTGGGVTKSANLTVTPAGTPPPAATLSSFTVNPSSVPGGTSATGTVRLATAAPAGGTAVTLGSNQPGAASVPSSVVVPAGATSATFTVTTFPSQGTTVQLSARLGDTILFAALGVTAPAPSPTPSAPTLVSPANGSTPSQPITFDWSDVANAVSYDIQIDDSSTFTAPLVLEQTVTSSQFTSGSLPAVRHFWRVRGVNSAGTRGAWSSVRSFTPQGGTPPPPSSTFTLTVSATGRSGERVISSPAGISVNVGSTGSASFGSGTSITLSVSNGRDAIWSGACSSGGDKRRTCTFTLNANAAVTANVQ
jgi:hypothetical protein